MIKMPNSNINYNNPCLYVPGGSNQRQMISPEEYIYQQHTLQQHPIQQTMIHHQSLPDLRQHNGQYPVNVPMQFAHQHQPQMTMFHNESQYRNQLVFSPSNLDNYPSPSLPQHQRTAMQSAEYLTFAAPSYPPENLHADTIHELSIASDANSPEMSFNLQSHQLANYGSLIESENSMFVPITQNDSMSSSSSIPAGNTSFDDFITFDHDHPKEDFYNSFSIPDNRIRNNKLPPTPSSSSNRRSSITIVKKEDDIYRHNTDSHFYDSDSTIPNSSSPIANFIDISPSIKVHQSEPSFSFYDNFSTTSTTVEKPMHNKNPYLLNNSSTDSLNDEEEDEDDDEDDDDGSLYEEPRSHSSKQRQRQSGSKRELHSSSSFSNLRQKKKVINKGASYHKSQAKRTNSLPLEDTHNQLRLKPLANRKRVAILPRSKNGCWVCRIRHLKCDESKPGCINCNRLNIHCDYSRIKPDYVVDSTLKAAKLREISTIWKGRFKKDTLVKRE